MNEKLRPSQQEARSGRDPFRLIVCERDGRWAGQLRRELEPGELRVYETRWLQECWRMLPECPAALLLVEVNSAWAGQLLALAARLGREFPDVRWVAIADDRLRWAKWAMLEAGAVWFCDSPRRLADVAQIARRRRAQVPRPSLDLEQKIWAALPWKTPGV